MSQKSTALVAVILFASFSVNAKDCSAVCYAKDKKTVERTLKWTCPDSKSCSSDCTTGKTTCADPVTLKPLPGEKEKKK
jgi:hypothetical protein